MTNTALAPRETADLSIMEQVIIQGDLAKLKPEERVQYYNTVCQSVGLSPFSRPFDYINLNGKLTLYAKKDATDQLRKIYHVSIDEPRREVVEGVYVVTTTARTPDGRTDTSIGAVNIEGLKGEAKANAMMKAETKSKRRVTLSICGLGWLDETEVETIPNAGNRNVDTVTGEILDVETKATTQCDTAIRAQQHNPASLEDARAFYLTELERCRDLNIDPSTLSTDKKAKYDRAVVINPASETDTGKLNNAATFLKRTADWYESLEQTEAAETVDA